MNHFSGVSFVSKYFIGLYPDIQEEGYHNIYQG